MEGLTLLDRRVVLAGLDFLSWFQISSHDSVHLDKGVTQPSLVCYRLSALNCEGSDSEKKLFEVIFKTEADKDFMYFKRSCD